MFTDIQQKWSTTEQKPMAFTMLYPSETTIYQDLTLLYAITTNPYGSFLSDKNVNNKVNRWSLESTTYNITFEWISGTNNKAAYCLSWLVDVKDTPVTFKASINTLVTSTLDGPATHINSKTLTPTDITPHTGVKYTLNTDKVRAPPLPTEDCKDTLTNAEDRSLLQMHFKMASQWQSTFQWSWHFQSYYRSSLQTCYGLKSKILGTSHP